MVGLGEGTTGRITGTTAGPRAAATLGVLCGILVLVVGWSDVARAATDGCAQEDALMGEGKVCTNEGAACTNGGTCMTVQAFSTSSCQCKTKQKKGCFSAGAATFDAGGAGLPTEGATIVYTAIADPANFWGAVNLDDGSPIAEFGPGDVFLTGSVTLHYGSFADPLAVPVELVDLSLTAPSVVIRGQATGINAIHLPAGPFSGLVYDSTTGTLSVDPEGIPVEIDDDLVVGHPATLDFSAQLDPNGALVTGNGITYYPNDLPAVSAMGLWVLAALLAVSALLVWRTRIWSYR